MASKMSRRGRIAGLIAGAGLGLLVLLAPAAATASTTPSAAVQTVRITPATTYTGSGGCFTRTFSTDTNWFILTTYTQLTLKNVCPITAKAKVEITNSSLGQTWSPCTSISRDASNTWYGTWNGFSNSGTRLTGRWATC
ncbi:hypothetical protein ACUOFU_07460 [Microbacterium arabinogalactanolyticum]|uniref:hypothetical protein n=1 Tax=Microbacterium arabinogalactanolyticum TaxID=69365 RepID=UPI00404430B6